MKLQAVAVASFLLGLVIAQALHTRALEQRVERLIETVQRHDEVVQTWERLSNYNFGGDSQKAGGR